MNEQKITLLVQDAQEGDQDAFGQLAQHFEPTVYAIALRRLRNRSEASDATQDIFIQAMRKLPQLREAERFPGWLKRVAVRMSINRAMRRPKEASTSPEVFNSLDNEPNTPLDNLLHQEQAHQVRGGLDRLRELDRKTLIAFYFEGQSLKEMSDQFDSPVGTIKRRLHTARNRLREELTEMQPA